MVSEDLKQRQLQRTSAFKKHVKKCQKRGYEMGLLKKRIGQLIHAEPLPPEAYEHWLVGNWKDRRECRVRDKIKDDWVLIYSVWDEAGNPVPFEADRVDIESQTLILEATGTHADLLS